MLQALRVIDPTKKKQKTPSVKTFEKDQEKMEIRELAKKLGFQNKL